MGKILNIEMPIIPQEGDYVEVQYDLSFWPDDRGSVTIHILQDDFEHWLRTTGRLNHLIEDCHQRGVETNFAPFDNYKRIANSASEGDTFPEDIREYMEKHVVCVDKISGLVDRVGELEQVVNKLVTLIPDGKLPDEITKTPVYHGE